MESLFVMAQVAPTEYPKDNLEKADSLVKEAAEKYHPGMIIFQKPFMSRFPAGTDMQQQMRLRNRWTENLCRNEKISRRS